MSLPPGFLDELRSRTSLSQVVGRKVIWDTRKSNQAKGDMWAPCPFHHEKTASFHVDDQKGFYYCFGCHAKGDALSFVRETENVGFMEAVEILAAEAGMQMPARDPQAQQKADRRTQLVEVMEAAQRFYRMQLASGVATEARAYLERRGLNAAAQERHGIGFAPPGWQVLWEHLTGKGIPPDLILAAGLAKPSQKGGKPYDTFRNRIQFPIRDARGRMIAFGGRAMDPEDGAKYLNSPETDLFDKGRTLYNHGPAREAAGKGAPLIVAEGYMDVIALAEAGFGAAVAPLGTAVTETQLGLLWRVADEPVLALDGDKAGLRAAERVIDLALPLLTPGKSLRFVLLPEGMDPDDLLRAKGPAAMQALLDAARPLVDLLWDRETRGRGFDAPERRAALDKRLDELTKMIVDPTVRPHYERALRDRKWAAFSGTRRGGPRAVQGVTEEARRSSLAAGEAQALEAFHERLIFAVLLTTPELLHDYELALDGLTCAEASLAELRAGLLRHSDLAPEVRRAALEESLGRAALDAVLRAPHVAIAPAMRHPGDLSIARHTIDESLARIESARGLAAEIAEAAADLGRASADEVVTRRLRAAAEEHARAAHGTNEDTEVFDTAPNGARLSRDEKRSFEALLGRIATGGGKKSL